VGPRKIIIDCDPGQDDAVALFLALAAPDELDVLGITTVAGNVPLELTQRNARMMCDIAGRTDIPVYAGCKEPLVLNAETPLQDEHAVDFIIETLRAAEEGTVTLVPTGPMTNIATAINRDPSVLDAVDRIVSMGGAMREGGNRSPSAEFNVLVDPHAAEIVYQCGKPVTAMGLDVTHQVLSTRERVGRIRQVGNAVATATADMLSFFHRYDTKKYGSEGAPLHDPCTVAWLLCPGLFASKACNLSVETQSELTMGHTAVDFWHVTDRPHNVEWAFEVDADGFYELLVEKLAVFGD
jgi:purine nucleosidase